MNVLVVGMSHRSAPVEVLERAAVGVDEVPKLLDEMLRGTHVTEVMMLSTCNRIEVYAVVDAFHGGLADVSTVLGRHAALPLPELMLAALQVNMRGGRLPDPEPCGRAFLKIPLGRFDEVAG